MDINGAKILITGGCGLIGSTTIDLLLRDYSPARIVIFDNHPDSLRLVLNSGVDADSDDTSRRERRTSIICKFILIAMLVAAVLWSLCW